MCVVYGIWYAVCGMSVCIELAWRLVVGEVLGSVFFWFAFFLLLLIFFFGFTFTTFSFVRVVHVWFVCFLFFCFFARMMIPPLFRSMRVITVYLQGLDERRELLWALCLSWLGCVRVCA